MSKFHLRRRARRKQRQIARRRPINVLASALTTMGLYCGIASIFASIKGEYPMAAYFILGAIVFDTLDGTVAKLTKTMTEFGKQLDSLSDVVAFGVAPAVLIFTAYIQQEIPPETVASTLIARLGGVVAIVYVICGALRLARFNAYQSERRDYFTGLPIPAAGATIATFVLFAHYFELRVLFRVIAPLTLLIAYLMVSTVRYPKDKMKAMVLAPRNAFQILVFLVIGIAIIHLISDRKPAIALAISLFPLALVYLLYGIGDTVYLRVFRRQSPPAPAVEAPPVSDALSEVRETSTSNPPSSDADAPQPNIRRLF